MQIDPMDHLNLVYEVGSRIHGKFDKDDLHQIGFIALMKACERFRPELGFKFSTYAVPIIKHDMYKFAKKELDYSRRSVVSSDVTKLYEDTNLMSELSEEDNELLFAVVKNNKKKLMKKLNIDMYEFKRRAKKVLDKL